MHQHCRAGHIGNRRGFTLVELLVALTISAVLAIAVVGALRAGLLLSGRTESAGGTDTQARLLLDILETELTGVYYPRGEEGAILFEQVADDTRGETKTTFCTTMPGIHASGRPGRCARVTYIFRKEVGQAVGVLSRQEEELAGETLIAEPVSQLLATGMSSFELQFWDARGNIISGRLENVENLPRQAGITLNWPGAGQGNTYVSRVFMPASSELASKSNEDNGGK